MFNKLASTQTLLYGIMLLALAGSISHLAKVYATIDSNLTLGYLQAIAIDGGIFAITYSIQQRKQQKRSYHILWVGLLLFAGISIYGNFTFAVDRVDIVKATILSASLPVLVLFLTEIISENKRYSDKIAGKQPRKMPILQPEIAELQPPITQANVAKKSNIAERRQKVLQLHSEGLQPKEIALQVDVKDVRTIKNDLLQLNGKVQK